MEPIIAPVSVELLKAELTPAKKLRDTNKSKNEIYVINHHDSPNVMMEIGRLREEAFRDSGGGSGLSMDIDEFDTMETPYQQLIVWDPDAEKILGGYRFIYGNDIKLGPDGQPLLATAHMFHFSEKFMKEYAPLTIELGRSFVTLEYQSSRMGTKGLFALDNLWDGLGAVTVIEPNVRYLFGKFTMYPSFDRLGRDMIIYFLNKHFRDKEGLVVPATPLLIETPEEELDAIFCKDNFKENYRILKHEVHKFGLAIPPMVNAYMGLSPTMKIFGTAVNYDFGNVEETGLLIAVDELQDSTRMRYIESFVRENPGMIKLTSGANNVFYEDGK